MTIWKTYKLGEIAEIIGGGTPSTKELSYWNGEISWITPKDLSNYNSKYIGCGERNITELGLEKSSAKILPKNTVLLTSRAPVGYLAIASNEVATNQGFKSLIVNETKADYEFVFYLLKNNVEFLKSQSSGSTFGEISGSTLKTLEFSFPDLLTQRAIAEILSSLDDKIELNNQMNKTLEEMAQTVFKQWFVVFDFPDKNGNPYNSSGGEMIESELGLIPKGWKVKRVDENLKIKHGFAFKGEFISDEENVNILLTPGNFKIGGGFNNNKFRYYHSDYPDDYVLMFQDLIVTMTDLSKEGDTLGFSALVPKISEKKFLHNQRLGKVELFKENGKMFFYWLLRQDNYRHFVLGSATGSTVKHTSPSRIGEYQFVKPKDEIIQKFEIICKDLFLQDANNFSQSIILKQTRDLLLPKLLSGEIDVSEAESIIEESEVLQMAAEPITAYNKSK